MAVQRAERGVHCGALALLVTASLVSLGIGSIASAAELGDAGSVVTETTDNDSRLQQDVLQTLSGFIARLKSGQKGTELMTPADAVVKQWLSAPSLARRLAGQSNWQKLTALQKQEIADELVRTLTRYVLEAAEQYGGQQLNMELIDASSKARRMVHLSLSGVSGMPNIPIVLELVPHQGSWRVADFSVEGVSYAGTKRWQYEVLWLSGGYAAFLDHIKSKNDLFFSELIPATNSQSENLGPRAQSGSGVLLPQQR